ncbi:MAG: hypothetical protein AB1489_42745, partial [Acidobacteriota bacterium]
MPSNGMYYLSSYMHFKYLFYIMRLTQCCGRTDKARLSTGSLTPSIGLSLIRQIRNTICLLFIAYAFLFVTLNNGNAGFFRPKVKDYINRKGFTWNTDSTNNLKLYFEPNTPAEQRINELKKNAEQSFARVLQLLGEQTYRHQVNVFIVDSRSRMKALVGREVNGSANPEINTIFYVFGNNINASGSHEFCHVLAVNSWGKAEIWINEGLAVYSDDNWHGYKLHELSKHLLLKGELIPLEKIVKDFRKYPTLITYPESGSFVKFLCEEYGMNKVKEMWKKGASHIPKIFDKSLKELEKEWHNIIE